MEECGPCSPCLLLLCQRLPHLWKGFWRFAESSLLLVFILECICKPYCQLDERWLVLSGVPRGVLGSWCGPSQLSLVTLPWHSRHHQTAKTSLWSLCLHMASSVLGYERKPCGEPEQPGLFCDSPCGFGVGVCVPGLSWALAVRAESVQGAGCPIPAQPAATDWS